MIKESEGWVWGSWGEAPPEREWAASVLRRECAQRPALRGAFLLQTCR